MELKKKTLLNSCQKKKSKDVTDNLVATGEGKLRWSLIIRRKETRSNWKLLELLAHLLHAFI